MRVLALVHGYPPRESAGTEQHTATLVEGLRARGHEVHVLAATRAPGRRAYEILREPGLTRVVNNTTARPLAQAEADGSIDECIHQCIESFRPDLVHVQHLQFLSSTARLPAPWVATLHDAWAWCPAGGALLRPDGAVCDGPEPSRCAPCAAAWAPTPSRAEAGLTRAAGAIAPWVAPERLHALYQRLPARLRLGVRRGGGAVEPAAAAARRNAAMRDLYRQASARLAPSRYLAGLAEAQGLGPVTVVPHGVDDRPALPRRGDGPILFLGTLARHKGPDLVVRAWRRAFPGGDPPLRLHGPGDARLALGHPLGGPLDRAGVWRALSEARVLVMGSRWPENAPLVLLEARAAGCPVIAPAAGGVPELVVEGVDGWLYPPDDEVALAEALARAVRSPAPRPRPPPRVEQMIDRTLEIYEAALRRA